MAGRRRATKNNKKYPTTAATDGGRGNGGNDFYAWRGGTMWNSGNRTLRKSSILSSNTRDGRFPSIVSRSVK